MNMKNVIFSSSAFDHNQKHDFSVFAIFLSENKSIIKTN